MVNLRTEHTHLAAGLQLFMKSFAFDFQQEEEGPTFQKSRNYEHDIFPDTYYSGNSKNLWKLDKQITTLQRMTLNGGEEQGKHASEVPYKTTSDLTYCC